MFLLMMENEFLAFPISGEQILYGFLMIILRSFCLFLHKILRHEYLSEVPQCQASDEDSHLRIFLEN